MTRMLPIATIASLLAVSAPATALAQPAIVQTQWGQSRSGYERSFDEGYRSGLREGERDARSGRRPDFRRQDEYRRGSNSGWNIFGRNDRTSEDAFRRGFAEGYTAGYDRYRGAYGSRYPVEPRGGYDGRYGYPGGGYGYPGGGYGHPDRGRSYSPAAQRGFEDGYRDGRDDSRDRDRYEPTRKKDYRKGDDGYDKRYGSRDRYKDEYRRAFQQGYDMGYREGRYR